MENNTPIRKQAEDFISITDLWHICISHWNWYVVSLLICLAGAFYYLMGTPYMYTREAAILVKQEQQGKNAGKSSSDQDFNDLGMIQQAINVINVQRQLASLEVLTEVARRMQTKKKDSVDYLQRAQGIQKRLKVEIDDEKSTIINLKYDAYSFSDAETVLNLIVQVFNEKWIQNKNDLTASTSNFIEKRLRLLERDLGSVDDSISNYKSRYQITDLDQVSNKYLEQQSQSDAQILTLTNQKAMAQYILGILRDKSSQHQLLPTNSGINNSVAETQIAQYNTTLLQLKNNMYNTSDQNPLIIKQESDLSDLRKNILATISNHIKALDIQLRSYEGASGEANSKISSNPRQAKHLASVQREQKVKESLYLYLLQKKEETEISMTYNTNITEVVDMPHGPDSPTAPNKRNIYAAAILLGLLVPTVILFVRENMNSKVRDKSDVERKTKLSFIGEIPLHTYSKKRTFLAKLLHKDLTTKEAPLVVKMGERDTVNEAFRLIRSNLEFMTSMHNNKNVYIVTSSNVGSGKSFVSCNLSIALAIKEKRVLLIDGDLRRASSSRNFNCPDTGLADYLAGQVTDLSQLIVRHEEYPTLEILPVGTIPPIPTELLSDELFKQLLDELRPQYDFIIIDCPPSESLADAGIIERLADRTLFVIRTGLFERNAIYDLEEDANNGKYKHILLILNGTKLAGRYGYKYGYKYGYGYHSN